MRQKRSFLSDNVWKTIPRTKYSKSSKDLLVDVAADAPSLLKATNEFVHFPNPEDLRRLIKIYNTLRQLLVFIWKIC